MRYNEYNEMIYKDYETSAKQQNTRILQVIHVDMVPNSFLGTYSFEALLSDS